jgi:tetratricopeptide (TPR) repeat protein
MTRARVPMAAVALAALLRCGVHAQVHDYELYRVPLVDAQENVEWAMRLASGGADMPDVYYKPPLYPHVLGVWMRIAGMSVGSAYWLNVVLGLANVWLVHAWMRRVAGPRWAAGAALLAACYGPFVYFEMQALPATLGVTLGLASLLLLDSTARRPNGPGRAALAAGASLGLLVVARPSFALWAAVAIVWLLAQRGRWGVAFAVAATAALVVLPVTIRNKLAGDAWVLVSANGGINFYLGNNADATRTSALRPGLEWENLVRDVPPQVRRSQASWDRHFAGLAWDWVRQEPAAFLRNLGRKTLQYVDVREIHRNIDPSGFRRQSPLLRVLPRTGWLLALALLGACVAWQRGGAARLTLIFAVAGAAATILVFVAERYRLDVAPAVLCLALLGAGELAAHLRRRPATLRRPAFLTMCAAAVAVTSFDLGGIAALQQPRAVMQEGVALYVERKYVEAAGRLSEAVEAFPQDADAQFQLGTAYQHLGRLDAALAAYETAHRLVPGHPTPLVNAAWILRGRGDLAGARIRYERAVELDPTDVTARFQLADVLEAQGERRAAEVQLLEALQRTQDAAVRQELLVALDRVRQSLER